MILEMQCRACGRLFDLDRAAIVVGRWRLCPDCRGPLPPTGGVSVPDLTGERPLAKEAA